MFGPNVRLTFQTFGALLETQHFFVLIIQGFLPLKIPEHVRVRVREVQLLNVRVFDPTLVTVHCSGRWAKKGGKNNIYVYNYLKR